MSGVVGRKSVETAILSSLLFYAFANPSTFKTLKKFPGLKFVMKSAKEITHSGVVVNAMLFGVVLFFCVWLINKTMLSQYFNIVEGLEGQENESVDPVIEEVASASVVDDSAELERELDADEDADDVLELDGAGRVGQHNGKRD
jgi:hypothetical protein